MNYTNEIPAGTIFSMVSSPIRAAIEVDITCDYNTLLQQDIEITLPYKLRPEFGFAGRTVSLKKLLQFVQDEGSPLSRDRDLTLRHQARELAMVENGSLYDHHMYADLPPQAHEEFQTSGFSFCTNYVMRLVASDIDDVDPDGAARLRQIADTYYPESEHDEPTAEEHEQILDALEKMLAANSDMAGEGDGATVICCTGRQ